jgi:hypothetical protein
MPRKHPIASVYLEPEALAALDGVAARERRSRSNLIGVFVTEGLARRLSQSSEAEDASRAPTGGTATLPHGSDSR